MKKLFLLLTMILTFGLMKSQVKLETIVSNPILNLNSEFNKKYGLLDKKLESARRNANPTIYMHQVLKNMDSYDNFKIEQMRYENRLYENSHFLLNPNRWNIW